MDSLICVRTTKKLISGPEGVLDKKNKNKKGVFGISFSSSGRFSFQ